MKTVRSLQPSQDNVLFMPVAGGIFVGLGLLLISSGKLTTLTCNRVGSTLDQCQLVSSGILGSLMQETRHIELQGAKVEANPMDDDASRVILLTKSGEILFTSSTIDNDIKSIATASDINDFVKQVKKASLTIHNDERWHYVQMGGFIISFGLLTWVFSALSRHNLGVSEKPELRAKR